MTNTGVRVIDLGADAWLAVDAVAQVALMALPPEADDVLDPFEPWTAPSVNVLALLHAEQVLAGLGLLVPDDDEGDEAASWRSDLVPNRRTVWLTFADYDEAGEVDYPALESAEAACVALLRDQLEPERPSAAV